MALFKLVGDRYHVTHKWVTGIMKECVDSFCNYDFAMYLVEDDDRAKLEMKSILTEYILLKKNQVNIMKVKVTLSGETSN